MNKTNNLKAQFLKGDLVGQKVWITDYRLNNKNILYRPIRSIVPIQVEVCDNTTLPSNKKIYYSNYHFKHKKKVISLFDNTGFRSYTGEPLNLFLTEDEAIDCWNSMVEANDLKLLQEVHTVQDNINKIMLTNSKILKVI